MPDPYESGLEEELRKAIFRHLGEGTEVTYAVILMLERLVYLLTTDGQEHLLSELNQEYDQRRLNIKAENQTRST